jgi:hypothetical protein
MVVHMMEPKEAPGSERSWMPALEGSPGLGTKAESVVEAGWFE